MKIKEIFNQAMIVTSEGKEYLCILADAEGRAPVRSDGQNTAVCVYWYRTLSDGYQNLKFGDDEKIATELTAQLDNIYLQQQAMKERAIGGISNQ